MSEDIFASPDARQKIEAWYDRFEAKIEAPTEHFEVDTSYGPNHMLRVGDPNLPH